MLLTIVAVVNLLLSVTVLIFVLLSRRPAGGSEGSARALEDVVRQESQKQSGEIRQEQKEQRSELSQMLRASSESQTAELARERELRAVANRELSETLGKSHSELKSTLEQRFDVLRQENEAKLEKMRETVDEKLQGTLERRLGESFKLVSTQLEQVQKGLGEMQTLASDVGGLKRVLTNVKSRGGWGEVQLARQLEDVLTPEQYAENIATLPGSNERVEFAVKLPGAGDGEKPVWLPIDSKFPQEDYERLLTAQESGDATAIEAAGRDIERAVLAQAKTIAGKYVEPPHTTDFGIMYLPTEGLFAEVMRRPGFVTRLQNEQRIVVVGPTTLMALLNSLQMGFRTLAIEKRSSEVWQVLSAAKTEFQKYGQVWEKLGKQLQTAQNTVSEAGRRTRAVERRLRSVETLEVGGSEQRVLGELFPDVEDAPAGGGADGGLGEVAGDESAVEEAATGGE
ncbi:MAG: DNA recombination protein RmuC [Actinobacteria bacterium]|nr:DNA recombination protein RmuC [Actinomycetota bacterium]